MPQLIRLKGIRAEGRHGASQGEQGHPQPFVVDLEVVVEAISDDLGSTADYRDIVAAVRSIVSDETHALIETLAERVALAAAQVSGAFSCRATVHKPEAAQRLGLTEVSAEVVLKTPPREGI